MLASLPSVTCSSPQRAHMAMMQIWAVVGCLYGIMALALFMMLSRGVGLYWSCAQRVGEPFETVEVDGGLNGRYRSNTEDTARTTHLPGKKGKRWLRNTLVIWKTLSIVYRSP